MVSMSLFLFNRELRERADSLIFFGCIWEDDAEHKLISELFDGEKTPYYLFNFIKIWQVRN